MGNLPPEPEPEPESDAPEPLPGLLTTIGILNIVIGGALLLCGLGCLTLTAATVVRGVPLRIEPEETQAFFDEIRNEQIKSLRKQEQATATDTERDRLRKERLAVEAKHLRVTDELDFPKINAELSRLGSYLRLDVLSGPVLNLLLVISGIGLVLRRNWARVLAIATATLKFFRLLGLTTLLVGSVIPHLSAAFDILLATEIGRQTITHAVAVHQAQQGLPPGAPKPTPKEIARALPGTGTGFATFLACFGSIYPIVVLILLSRPGARAAALPVRSPAEETPEF
jgi:hypothetical protein